MLLPLGLPFLAGLALSAAMECFLIPKPVPVWRRPPAAPAVHLGVWTAGFALEVMLFQRPYFAAANVLAVEAVILLVSNVKYRALREPFVFQDFEYFSDAVRHPRLYLPFFGAWRALAALGGYGLALWAGLSLEPALLDPFSAGNVATLSFFAQMFVLCAAGAAIAWLGGRRLHATFAAEPDLRQLGLAASLWAYARAEAAPADALRAAAPFAATAACPACSGSLPDMVVIQSESFFDVRRAYQQVEPTILSNFDLLAAESALHGELRVGAWGANTVRTEFGFLAGLGSQALGVHAYNPYRRLARGGFPTIASYLRGLGYRTICLHPYHRTFYRRHQVLPMMGFDLFIGLEAFADTCREGAYISDAAVAARLVELLKESSDQPLYVHVITMENHGPLHWEQLRPDDFARALRWAIPDGCRDLVAYVRHLINADAMFGTVREALLARDRRPSVLCIFGDHVPIMPAVYQQMGQVSGNTDYLIWRSDRHVCDTSARPLDVSELAATYLETIQLGPRQCSEGLGPVQSCGHSEAAPSADATAR